MNLDLIIIIIIIITSFIQSLFGTGVLLFGTPVLLILGYDFFFALSILLPTSVIINVLQIKDSMRNIDINFYKKMLFYSVPFIIISLYFLNFVRFEIHLYVGVFLLIIVLKNYNKRLGNFSKTIAQYQSIYLIVMGVIHGLTNLGGALLSALVLSNNNLKENRRSTIAACYLSMGIIQIATLVVAGNKNLFLNGSIFTYWLFGPIIFIFAEHFIYLKIDERFYNLFSDIFLFTIGIVLVFKVF
jgi:uncharacterized protein